MALALLPLFGVAVGLAVAEVAVRFADLRTVRARPADPHWRMHYIDTETGMGKCYPSDPRGYFPYDLRTEAGMRDLGTIIATVSGLPDEMELPERIEHLRRHAPHCNNIELHRLNGGPDRGRSRHVLIIGDSFAFGEGLRTEDTIGFRLAEYFPDINFGNMAWPGTSVDTIYDVRAVGPEVDTVLYLYNINDLLRTDELQQRRLVLHDTNLQARLQPDVGDGTFWATRCRFLRLCRLAILRHTEAERSQDTIDYYHDIYFSPENAARRQRSLELLEGMQATLSERNVRFVVAMFPLYYSPPLSPYPFRRIHEFMASEMDRLGIEFVDLLPAYDRHLLWDKFTVHPLDRHPSAVAIEAAAAHLRDHLDLGAPAVAQR